MNALPSKSLSKNRQSAIQNLESVVIAVVITFAMCGAVAQAQQQGRTVKIGWLTNCPASSPSSEIEVVRRELAALGWVEADAFTKGVVTDALDSECKQT